VGWRRVGAGLRDERGGREESGRERERTRAAAGVARARQATERRRPAPPLAPASLLRLLWRACSIPTLVQRVAERTTNETPRSARGRATGTEGGGEAREGREEEESRFVETTHLLEQAPLRLERRPAPLNRRVGAVRSQARRCGQRGPQEGALGLVARRHSDGVEEEDHRGALPLSCSVCSRVTLRAMCLSACGVARAGWSSRSGLLL
jgi:hypothetical protein